MTTCAKGIVCESYPHSFTSSSLTAFTDYCRLPGPFLLSYSVFVFTIPYFSRFWAVRKIKLAISSAFKRTLIYRIVSYRIKWSLTLLLTLCGLTSQKTHRGRLGLGELVHKKPILVSLISFKHSLNALMLEAPTAH